MSIKKYGIYLAYPPTVDLRHEGLGRYLAAFLKGAAHRADVRFILICPSWSRASLEDLFNAEAIPQDSFEIVAPNKTPIALRLHQKWLIYRKKIRKPSPLNELIASLKSITASSVHRLAQKLVTATSWSSLFLNLPLILGLALIAALLSPLWFLKSVSASILKRGYNRYSLWFAVKTQRIKSIVSRPKDYDWIVQMYQTMELKEAERMQKLIEIMSGIRAWYAPTAFWPGFNNIEAPRLMCVPDVVLTDFPIGFSGVGGNRFLQNFEKIEANINEGTHFVTYSENVRWATLVDRYNAEPDKVTAIHHAPNDLSPWVTLRGFEDAEDASKSYCRTLLINAIKRSPNAIYTKGFANSELGYLFYASQARPNKNILTLLKAYEYLLRKRHINLKLILTANPSEIPEIQRFIADHHLRNEVFILHGLKTNELAACYKLAELAVNPSLSEGGCPFTFTEALSVNTPVVMANIPVTQEVLTDPEIRSVTLFNPYDWKDLADKVEWAIENREAVLDCQRSFYKKLSERTWGSVVDEHIIALEKAKADWDQESKTCLPL